MKMKLSLVISSINFAVLLPFAAASREISSGVVHRRTREQFRLLQDDDITSEIPNVIDFSIHNESIGGDVCQTGCEGDYSAFDTLIDDLFDQQGKEYELFFSVKGRYAVAVGVIYDNFPARVQQLRDEHPEVDTLILYDCPGSANDLASIPGATLVHQLGYQTCVPSNGYVASGGTDFFVSGAKRYATPGSQVGIHSWATGSGLTGLDLPRDHPDHKIYLELYNTTCIPADFYWKTLSYGLPIHVITETEFDVTFPYMRDCSGECKIDPTSSVAMEPSAAPGRWGTFSILYLSLFTIGAVTCQY